MIIKDNIDKGTLVLVSVSLQFRGRSPLHFSGSWHKSSISSFKIYGILIVMLIQRYLNTLLTLSSWQKMSWFMYLSECFPFVPSRNSIFYDVIGSELWNTFIKKKNIMIEDTIYVSCCKDEILPKVSCWHFCSPSSY